MSQTQNPMNFPFSLSRALSLSLSLALSLSLFLSPFLRLLLFISSLSAGGSANATLSHESRVDR